ncbi:MAG: DUF1616 domain-containing protein [Haloarculaceae archaeon]
MGGASGPNGDSPTAGQFGRLPADLAVVVALVVVTDVVVLAPVLNESPLRVVLGAAFVLVLPGCAVVAALFPGDRTDRESATAGSSAEGTAETPRGIDGIERAALSLAVSIPVVSLLGLGLSVTPLGVGLASVLPAVTVVTLGATAVAAGRRSRLPPEDRFRVPYRQWVRAGRTAIFEADTRGEFVLTVLLVASVLLAIGSVTAAVVLPAERYPTEFTAGEPRPVVVGIENHEQQSVRYTVVTQLQGVRVNGTETSVIEVRELDRFSVELAAGTTWRDERSLAPTMSGDRLRVVYLLYRGAPPETPTETNAYRSVHLWVSVA